MRLSMEIHRGWLELLSPLCDVDFAIAHQVLEDKYYADFYAKQATAGRLVILDNGFHELGHPLTPAELLEAASRINPTVVIAPDRLGDYRFGLEQFDKMREVFPPEIELGAVLCGRSPAERADFFMHVRQHAGMLCLPFKEPRFEWYSDLLEKVPDYVAWPPRIHLLGVNEFWELKAFRELFDKQGVEKKRISVDTSKPIKFGVKRQRFNAKTTLRGLGALADVEKAATQDALLDVLYNIAFLRKYL